MELEYNAKWNKPLREGQIPYDFTHMWNLETKQMSKRKERERERERQTKKQILNFIDQINDYRAGRWMGEMGEMGDGD